MDATLRTARLTLVPVDVTDVDEVVAHWSRSKVRHYLFDGVAPSGEQVARVIAASEAGFAVSGHALWIVRADGAFVGVAGLRPFDRLGVEVYYSLAPTAWGRGYAVEAARAVTEHAFGSLGVSEIYAEVDVGNLASVAVIEKLAMVRYEDVDGVLGRLARYVLRG